jgi:hypothetical protein
LISLHSDGRIQGIPRELNTPERVFAQSNGRGQENPKPIDQTHVPVTRPSTRHMLVSVAVAPYGREGDTSF